MPRNSGERAERVADWYFRLNGFLAIPSFVVYPDIVTRHPRTEGDIIAVRFPHSREIVADRVMVDDSVLADLSSSNRVLFVLVEVKVGLCAVNGPWTNRSEANLQRVVRRLGFAQENMIGEIAERMYSTLRWEDHRYVLQYISVGAQENRQLVRQFPNLIQIAWDNIGKFLFKRFKDFPEKLPVGSAVHKQWPDFGKSFSRKVRAIDREEQAVAFVRDYIENGDPPGGSHRSIHGGSA